MTDDYLGYLVWWSVAHGSSLDYKTLLACIEGLDVRPPPPPHPAHVFRRVTGMKQTYDLENLNTLELSMVRVSSPHPEATMNRHMVATVRNHLGVVQHISKVGDVAFYRPPRSQMSKARIRIVPLANNSFPNQVQTFVRLVRSEYDRGVAGASDSQGIRRLAREHLLRHGAVHLNSAYFIERLEPARALTALFETLGEAGFLHIVPLVDTPEQREFLAAYQGVPA